MTQWSTFLIAPLCGLALIRGPTQPPADDSSQLLVAAANGYRANLESFEYMTCRYTATRAFAKSLDDAIAGRLGPKAHTATVVVYKDGKNLRFRLDEDAETKKFLDKPPPPQKSPELGGLMAGPLVPFITVDDLVTEAHGLLFDPRAGGASIYDGRSPKGKTVDELFLLTQLFVNKPFDYGLLADKVAGREAKAESKLDGEHFKTSFDLGEEPLVTYTVDLARGSLPTRIELLYKTMYKTGPASSTIVVPQIRACSKGRWFPERIVTFMKQTPTQSPCLVWDFKVTELDVDHRPSRESFKIDLPAGTVVNQFDEPRNYFKTRQPERVGPDDLDRMYQLTETVPKKPQTDTTIVLPRRYIWAWYAAAGIVLLVAAFFGRRYLATRTQHASV